MICCRLAWTIGSVLMVCKPAHAHRLNPIVMLLSHTHLNVFIHGVQHGVQ